MARLIRLSEDAHWYDEDGSPVYALPMARDVTRMRPPTVRDAKKLALVPSVTNILSVVRRPDLIAWQAEQYIVAALTLPYAEGESLDERARRAVRDAEAYPAAAAQHGTALHQAVEDYVGSRYLPPEDDPLHEYVVGFAEWFHQHEPEPEALEITFACLPEGYGGRLDLKGSYHGARLAIDWKTRETEPGKPIVGFHEWGAQLAGYGFGVFGHEAEDALLMNVVISRTEPGRVEALPPWPFRPYFEAFLAARDLWYGPLFKNWPRQEVKCTTSPRLLRVK